MCLLDLLLVLLEGLVGDVQHQLNLNISLPMLTRICRAFASQQRLFTPGPLNTTRTVKEAMLIDYGSRDPLFL
jgi:hypothetical protein